MPIDLPPSLLIDAELELLLVLPFRLGVEAPLPAARRAAIFPSVARDLNQRLGQFEWEAAAFGDEPRQHPVSTFVAKRKRVFLRGEPRGEEPLVTWLGTRQDLQQHYDLADVRHSVWYYDWGLGAVDVSIRLRLKTGDEHGTRPVSPAALTGLLDLGNCVALETRSRLPLFRTWDASSKVLIDALGARPFLGDTAGAAEELSGRLPYYAVALVIHSADEPARASRDRKRVELSKADLEATLTAFTGRSVEDQHPVQWPGLLAIADGFGGQVAIVDGGSPAAAEGRARVLWLWRLVSVSLANLEAVGRLLSEQTLDLFVEGHKATPATLERLRRDRLGIQAILQECTPLSVCGTALEHRVYGGMWNAWEGERLLGDVRGHLDFLREYFHETIDSLTTTIQNRLNWILYLLNVLTFAAAIATIITTYDWHNDELLPTARIALIATLTGLFAAMTLLLMLIGRFRSRW